MGEIADNKFIRRCLELAIRAEGLTYPNPLVGSVVVHNGKIIGEGYHLRAGQPHAEVNAINSVKEKELLRESTLYVNLEPCSHTGKTPPCADFIISHKIPSVVIGASDTSDKVSGKGIARLRNAGCQVKSGILEDECRYMNRRFFTFHEKKRPHITLKWAQSHDGFIDILRADSQPAGPSWISGKSERVLVHRWRSGEEAILAGAETIRKDDPMLNVREWKGHNPVRIVISRSGELPQKSAIFIIDGRTIVFSGKKDANYPGAETVLLNDAVSAAQQISDYLYDAGLQSLFIEGGAMVFDHFISEGLWDEARIFHGRTCFGSGVKAPAINGKTISETDFSCSSLEILLNSEHVT